MDFTPSEAAAAAAALAADIGAAVSTPERIAELEAAAAPIDTQLWRELATAGLLSVADLGVEATVAVATALGRHLARIPYGPHTIAALPMLRTFGGATLVELAAAAATGEAVLSAAVEQPPGTGPVQLTGSRLTGTAVNVPYADAATALLVEAVGRDDRSVVVVRTDTAGLTVIDTPSTGRTPIATVEFDGVTVAGSDVLAGGATTADRLRDLLRLAVAADQSGVVAAALDATAAYAREREQFGRPIGSFQAVAQRLADGYIDAQAVTLTTAQAAWLLSPEADASADEITAAVATAKFWADEAGHRIAHTAVHVHGGVGLDTSHPAHRYYLRAKQNEFALGSTPVVLDDLAGLIAAGG